MQKTPWRSIKMLERSNLQACSVVIWENADLDPQNSSLTTGYQVLFSPEPGFTSTTSNPWLLAKVISQKRWFSKSGSTKFKKHAPKWLFYSSEMAIQGLSIGNVFYPRPWTPSKTGGNSHCSAGPAWDKTHNKKHRDIRCTKREGAVDDQVLASLLTLDDVVDDDEGDDDDGDDRTCLLIAIIWAWEISSASPLPGRKGCYDQQLRCQCQCCNRW